MLTANSKSTYSNSNNDANDNTPLGRSIANDDDDDAADERTHLMSNVRTVVYRPSVTHSLTRL